MSRIAFILGENLPVALQPRENSLVISGQNADIGEGTEEIDATIIGTPTLVQLKPKYLLDYLNRTDVETVRLYVADPLQPIRIQPVGDDASTYIVMPMRG